MSLIGKEISDFTVQAYAGNEFKEVKKPDILGKWSVFFFYPADFTFVCPTELEDLADKYEEFKDMGCEIYSVSCDSHFVHKAWHDASKTVQKINDYELSSGEIVSDLELSNELNISRTPVREAMQQLIDIGLLERTATKVVVRSITLTDIAEIFQIREAIEIMSVKIILSRGGLNETQKLELMDIHQNLCNDISNGNFDKNFSDDTAFHEKLIEYSGNTRMEDICRRITLQSQRLRWLTLLTPSRYAGTRDEHQRIIQGILNQDLNSAARAIEEHLQGSLENYTQILNNNQWMKIMSELKNMNP